MRSFKSNSRLLLIIILTLSSVLRLLWLGKFPPSPYSDEVNQAYNAFAILKTGKDEHRTAFPVSFRSFGDWKPPLQTYLMIPSIAILGLNEVSLRIPSAILGILSVILSYFLVRELFYKNRYKEKLALLTSLLMAISPWHLHQSRSAMLVAVALFFFLLAIYWFLISLKRNNYLYLSITAFVFCIYAYYGMRLIVPLFLIVLFLKYYKKLLSIKKTFCLSLGLGLILLLPLLTGFLNESNIIFGRAKTVSIFFDKGIRLKSAELQQQDMANGIHDNISLLFHNQPYLYGLDILKRFLTHFDGRFLFLTGDTAPPFRIPNMGVLYFGELVFIPLGLLFLLKNKEKSAQLIIVWLIISVIPAAFSFLTPSHNRAFNAVFPLTLLSAYGMLNLFIRFKKRIILLSIIFSTIYMLSFNYYLVNYYKVLPLDYGLDWLYGFREIFSYLNEHEKDFSKIIFLPKTGKAYTYQLFYNKFPPEKLSIEVKRSYTQDEFGFEHVSSIGKYYYFRNNRSWEELEHQMEKGEIYIGREGEIPKEKSKHEIFYPDGKAAFRITYL